MKIQSIDGALWRKMVLSAGRYLGTKKDAVDALNVFPVPDGDTGTNMWLTLSSAARILEPKRLDSLSQLTRDAAQGALLGARGNSGVILSQFFTGVRQACEAAEQMDAAVFCAAMRLGAEMAFRAVMNPVQGTILTVMEEGARGAGLLAEAGETDVEALLKGARDGARSALKRTPEMLPILKQAGVVDAGGQGFVYILEGFLAGLRNREEPEDGVTEAPVETPAEDPAPAPGKIMKTDILYGYCTEMILRKKTRDLDLESIKAFLSDKGDSLLVVGAADACKIHMHTNVPGEVLSYGLNQCGGTLHDIKIDNLEEQAETAGLFAFAEPKAAVAAVAVAAGKGLEEIFKSLGADYVIAGGQTMNPSIQDFLEVMELLAAKEYILLPNNSNIVMAAEQAAKARKEGVYVVPSVTVPQGISALMAFNPELSAEENFDKMREAVKSVTTLEVTYAVRDADFEDYHIHEGEFLGFVERKLVYVGNSAEDTARALLARVIAPGYEIVTLYYGQDVLEFEARNLAEALSAQFPGMDVEFHQGGQPVYYYLISVE
ncbi:MAG: DAK2 domain-containing protein [Peptococcaceae bacterium]|nr:DAK2 domain-containing protein [Peptococcaceae bacterium]